MGLSQSVLGWIKRPKVRTIRFVMRIISSQLSKHIGSSATVTGWLHKKRAMGGLMFVVLRDRGGLVQVVVDDESEQEKLRGAQVGSIITVEGKVLDRKSVV